MMPCDRKSVEPMAAITAPDRTAAQHQSLLHFVGQGDWSDQQVLAKVREMVLPEIERHGPIEAWIIDDTAFPKKGRHSVGGCTAILRPVGQARQLSGRRDPFACKSSCELAGGLSSVSAKGVGDRPYTSAQSRCTQGNYLQDQAGTCSRSFALGLCGGLAARRGTDGRRLWHRHCSAWEYHRTWPELCGRHPTTNVGMGAWNWAAAAEEVVGERATSKVAAA